MSATLARTAPITITDSIVQAARETGIPHDATLVLRDSEGAETPLPDAVQGVLLRALSLIATRGEVTIGSMPEDLTSTVAADLLGISRPTLMKRAREGAIESFKVGTHTRFKRDDVLRARERRVIEQRAALAALQEFDAQHPELLDD